MHVNLGEAIENSPRAVGYIGRWSKQGRGGMASVRALMNLNLFSKFLLVLLIIVREFAL